MINYDPLELLIISNTDIAFELCKIEVQLWW